MRHTRLATMATAFTAVAVLGTTIAGTAQASEKPGPSYVALGDSFTAGPFIPFSQGGQPQGCGRSTMNYPTRVAETLGIALTDVSCSAAVIDHLTEPQKTPRGDTAPPQFDALRPGTDVVTVGIGGNDIGFWDIFTTCLKLAPTDPRGAPCTRHYVTSDGDAVAKAIAAVRPRIAAVLDGIHQRAPKARVLMVGYLDILPPASTWSCLPFTPIADGDVPYLHRSQQALNRLIADESAAHHASFVDVRTDGHDACAPWGKQWVEGLIPRSLAAPLHPNADGMRFVAGRVLRTLTGLSGGAVSS